MEENKIISNETFGNFTLLETTPKLHRFKTHGNLIHEYIVIRNLSGEVTEQSAKESLRAYLAYFGKSLRKER